VDWNWFFSSLAQSIAAIAGIVAAFAVTGLVSNQAEFKRQVARGEEHLARCRELVDKLSHRYFSWYNKRRLEEVLESVGAERVNESETDSFRI
jgi:regulator of sigma D